MMEVDVPLENMTVPELYRYLGELTFNIEAIKATLTHLEGNKEEVMFRLQDIISAQQLQDVNTDQ